MRSWKPRGTGGDPPRGQRRARTILGASIAALIVVGTALVAGSEIGPSNNPLKTDFALLECGDGVTMVQRHIDYSPVENPDGRSSAVLDDAVNAWTASVYYDRPTLPAGVDLSTLPAPPGGPADNSRLALTENGKIQAVLYFTQAPSGRWRLGGHVACGDWLATHDHLAQGAPE